MHETGEFQSHKIFLIGWACGNHKELDGNRLHYCVIKNYLLYDGIMDPEAVSCDLLVKTFHGLELTRLKAYELTPKVSQKRKCVV